MRVNRRQFLRGAGSAALLASGHVLALVPRRARAALPVNPVVVLVQLSGGNDALNTVIPVNNVGGAQRSLYDAYRPSLRVPSSSLAGTLIGADPVLGTGLAFHPVMTELKALYDAGHVAVLNGVGVPGAPLSHAGALEAWWAGDPAGFAGTGWLGRVTDATFLAADSPALALGLRPSGAFASVHANALAAPSLSDFELPDDPLHPDLTARAAAWTQIYAADAGDSPQLARIRRAGADVLAKAPLFETVQFSGWGSALDGGGSSLHRDLLQVSSLLRYDELFPDTASGIALYHVAQPGYDTHARQGAAEPEGRHPMLLSQLSDALARFSTDLAALGVQDRVLVLAYSEFGRRARECGAGDTAGTDHGAAGCVLALGGAVVGGVYGALPALDSLDANGNPPLTMDFRRVYATVIDRFLGANHADFLPGAPFAPLDFLPAP